MCIRDRRKGFHSAGIGLSAGKFIDANLDALIALLMQAEVCVDQEDEDGAAKAVVAFAELVFQTAPFQAPKELPAKWREALLAWLGGLPSADVVALCDGEGVDLIQEALAYRLPWAMEAVRVHALAVEHGDADLLTGLAAPDVIALKLAESFDTVVLTMGTEGVLVAQGDRIEAVAATPADGTRSDREAQGEWDRMVESAGDEVASTPSIVPKWEPMAPAPDAEALAQMLAMPDDDPTDLEALDSVWQETEVTFGPDPNAGCPQARDMLAAMDAPATTTPRHAAE